VLIERVTFHNEENGWAVLKVKAKGHRDLVTVVGSRPKDGGFRTGNMGSNSRPICLPAPRQPPRKASKNIWATAWLKGLARCMPKSWWTSLARVFLTLSRRSLPD
jgi:hypothetical protein